jgi:SRSO17 transposase
VSLSIANHRASLPVRCQLYLPKEWANNRARRREACVPKEIVFKTKPQIALEHLQWACEAGLPRGVALFDAGYGNDAKFRTGVSALSLLYVAGIQSNILVFPPGTGPRRKGRPLNNTGRRDEPDLVSVQELALSLPKRAWRTIKWHEGSAEWLSSRFARVRVRAAHGYVLPEQLAEEWLLIEWPEGEAEPTKYWLSTLPETVSFRPLVTLAKLRWRIERDYLELKQEIGLGHYEGRKWRGFHHHVTLCIAAYGFLVSEQETIPPSEACSATMFKTVALPERYRPRGSPVAH